MEKPHEDAVGAKTADATDAIPLKNSNSSRSMSGGGSGGKEGGEEQGGGEKGRQLSPLEASLVGDPDNRLRAMRHLLVLSGVVDSTFFEHCHAWFEALKNDPQADRDEGEDRTKTNNHHHGGDKRREVVAMSTIRSLEEALHQQTADSRSFFDVLDQHQEEEEEEEGGAVLGAMAMIGGERAKRGSSSSGSGSGGASKGQRGDGEGAEGKDGSGDIV